MPSIEIGDKAGLQLAEIARRADRSKTEVLDEAVGWLYQRLVGDLQSPKTLPFKKKWSDCDADVLLRQADAETFFLEESFRFVKPASDPIEVPRGNVTDLASVPSLLTWLVPRYGRHSLPALLHDHLIEPGTSWEEREAADSVFRDTMEQTQVPFVRRWLMWCAVGLGTYLQRPLVRIFLVMWLLVHLLVGYDLFAAAVDLPRVPLVATLPIIAVAVAPSVASVLWGRLYWFAAIAGYSLLVLPASVVAVGATLLVYLLLEGLLEVGIWVAQRLGSDKPLNPVRVSRL
ncbi:MAG: DUF1353 domain-containing protein [Actinomycetota bacterium]|nr:DUF1353 domain-containing protein [Actinomycetota bacterium]